MTTVHPTHLGFAFDQRRIRPKTARGTPSLENITAYAKKREMSDQNRILSHARNVLVQREIRRNVNATLRRAEMEHIKRFDLPTDEGDVDLARLRRELLLSGLK
jgi:hypothetical protein